MRQYLDIERRWVNSSEVIGYNLSKYAVQWHISRDGYGLLKVLLEPAMPYSSGSHLRKDIKKLGEGLNAVFHS
jgi:hypothetical protein